MQLQEAKRMMEDMVRSMSPITPDNTPKQSMESPEEVRNEEPQEPIEPIQPTEEPTKENAAVINEISAESFFAMPPKPMNTN
jgi:hypothetical protein